MCIRDSEVFEHVHAHAMNSATGFSSNVRDLLRFYSFHMRGNQAVLTDRSKRDMQRIQFEDGPYTWGLGFSIDDSGPERLVGHGGAYPGFMTASMLNPAKSLAVVVLTNAMDGRPQHFLQGILSVLRYAGDQSDKLGATASDDPVFYDRVAGYYGSRWGVSIVDRIDGKLVSVPTEAQLPGTQLARYEHLGNHVFKLAHGPKNGQFGETSEVVEVDGAVRVRAGLAEQTPFVFER